MELADPAEGASVAVATAYDERFPCDTVIDGDPRTFWTTTGSYPHELVVQLGGTSSLETVQTVTTNVRGLVVEGCQGPSPSGGSWDELYSTELEDTDGELTIDNQQIMRATCDFVRVRIMSGWKENSTVHKISIRGRK